MKRSLILVLCVLFAFEVWADDKSNFFTALYNARWTCVSPSGARYTTLTFREGEQSLFGNAQSITIAKYSASDYATMLVANEGNGKACKTSVAAMANNASFAINCSYFDNSGPNSPTFQQTAVPMWYGNQEYNMGKFLGINSGEDELNFNRDTGLVGFCDDGTISIEPFDAHKMGQEDYYEGWKSVYSQFIVSGPLLRVGGSNVTLGKGYNPWFEGLNPRSVFGKDLDGNVYMIVIDGRKCDAIKSVGTTIEETQKIAEWLGLSEAINLDGGGSSNVWERTTGILNWPSNSTSRRVERVIPNLIIAKKR